MSGEGKEEVGDIREGRAARGRAQVLLGVGAPSSLCYEDENIAVEGGGQWDRRTRKAQDGSGLGGSSWRHKWLTQ